MLTVEELVAFPLGEWKCRKLLAKFWYCGKSFGPEQSPSEINLELPAGMITVLMWANGAGKSTLVKILCVHQADVDHLSL
ncbi:MAG: hypothetical protein CM15mP85_24840 [Rhodobacterales bacterium]|nr:MAG: hypothetical protein CM15mP85_24840 [Rhodobacterales bacterium]